MLDVGIHYDVPESVYHADPCPIPSLSSSLVRVLRGKSPMHAYAEHPRLGPPEEGDEKETTAAMDAGTILHKMVLGRGKDIVGVAAKDWRTDAAKLSRKTIRESGRTPVLTHKLLELEAAAATMKRQLRDHVDGRLLFEPGHSEVVMIWEEDGLYFRALVDRMPDDVQLPLLDFKTTGMLANPEDWQRQLLKSYAIQDAFYRRGNMRLRGAKPMAMPFLVGEQKAPYATSSIACAPSLMAWADNEVEAAIATWRECLMSDTWPGYSKHTAYVEAPTWLLVKQEQRFDNDATEKEMAA